MLHNQKQDKWRVGESESGTLDGWWTTVGNSRGWRVRLLIMTWIMVLTSFATYSMASSSAGATGGASMSPVFIAHAGNSNTLYVLWGTPTCRHRGCLRIERSVNGGRSFTAVSVPAVSMVQGMNVAPLGQLLFTNPLDGYALQETNTGTKWSTNELFETTDGGKTWRIDQIAPHVAIYQLATSQRYTYAVTAQCTSKGKCSDEHLYRSNVASLDWTRLVNPPVLSKYWGGNISVAAYGLNVWLTTQDMAPPYSPGIAISQNRGQTFVAKVEKALSSAGSCGLNPRSATSLWAVCGQGNFRGDIVQSVDGGLTWQVVTTGPLSNFGFGDFEPVGRKGAFFIDQLQGNGLYRVSSEFSRPQHIASLPTKNYWFSLDLTNAKQGLALSQGPGGSYPFQLWSTNDGGAHWLRINAPQ